jgi:hypothetical protein
MRNPLPQRLPTTTPSHETMENDLPLLLHGRPRLIDVNFDGDVVLYTAHLLPESHLRSLDVHAPFNTSGTVFIP